MGIDTKETLSNTGKIIVVTGRTGSGKDFLTDQLETMGALDFSFSRVVTHATREKRDGEIPGFHYHFCSVDELFAMHRNGELVEDPVQTGSSYKATSKRELLQVFEGKSKIWRIDLSLAAKIASNDYYHRQFDSEMAKVLVRSTRVVFIDVDQETLDRRRKTRDGDRYDPREYGDRDSQERQIIGSYGHHFSIKLENPDGEIEKTKKQLYKLVQDFIK